MPVRTAYAGAAVSGEVLTAANVNRLPGGWIGYAEVTASQGSIVATLVDLTGLTVTVTVGASRRLRITGKVQLSSTVANDGAQMQIMEGATTLNTASTQLGTAAFGVDRHGSVVITPTAGSHTYKLAAQRTAGTGTVTSGASATVPAYILVEDIGPAT